MVAICDAIFAMICHVYALSTVTITNDKSVKPSVQVKPVTVQFEEYSSLCHTCAVTCDTCYTGKNPPKRMVGIQLAIHC